MPDDLEKRTRRWHDYLGIVVSAVAVAGLAYLSLLAVEPVRVKKQDGSIQTESWLNNYVGRRVPKQAARYKTKAAELFDDYISFNK